MKKSLFTLFFLISVPLFAQSDLEKNAQKGDVEAQYALGAKYHEEKRYKDAAIWFEKAAKQGHARSQSNLGLYYSSILQPKDPQKAFHWFTKSAEQGYAQAQFQLARCYETGLGCTKDYDLAIHWYMEAAKQGNTLAQDMVGYWIDNGTHLTEDKSKAFDWYMKAAQRGDAEAQVHVAIHLEKGLGIRMNHTEAFQWISKAAEQGYPQAMAKLARYYEEGVGCTKDPTLSSQWYKKAEQAGDLYVQSKKAPVNKKPQYLAGDLYYEIISPTEVKVASHSGHSHLTNVRIPSSVKINKAVYVVTAIAEDAFHFGINNYNLKWVSLPNTIETIGKGAFQGCSKLTNITIPKTVYYIGEAAFSGCNSLTDVTVPQKLTLIPKSHIFSDCCNLKSVNGNSTPSVEIPEWFKKDIVGTNSPLDMALNKEAKVTPPLSSGEDTPKASIDPIDVNIPVNPISNDRTFAVIIGNENYIQVAKVPYAQNDARIFADYCQKTLGIPQKNIKAYTDASFGVMVSAIDNIKKIAQAFKGDINVIFYYAGHGIPNEESKDAFLLPIDADGKNTVACYSINNLYKELAGLDAQSVTVFMDACFSGAQRGNGMIASARAVVIKPREEKVRGNMVVFSAASAEETAYPYTEKGHGLFTYFLLKKLQETCGNVTLGELSSYICEKVSQESVITNGKSQTPTVASSSALGDKWKSLKLINEK